MLIAILGDKHIGCSNDDVKLRKFQQRFYSDIFFPELKRRGIKKAISLGDVWDRRKYINFETLHWAYENVFDIFVELGIEYDVIVGNHDIYKRQSNKINSVDLLLDNYNNIDQIQQPKIKTYDGIKFMFIPWINEENEAETLKYIADNDADYCIAHLELAGFDMQRGMKAEHGMDSKPFEKFTEVWTGHYHHKSQKGNIKYLGTPYELTWHDEGDIKGFHIFDTETRTMEFIKNPYTLHEKFFYNDETTEQKEYLKNFKFDFFKDKKVKLFVTKKTDANLYEWFIENCYKSDYNDFSILEDTSAFHEVNVDITVSADASTKQLMNDYIDGVVTDMDKKKIKAIVGDVYMEALMGTPE